MSYFMYLWKILSLNLVHFVNCRCKRWFGGLERVAGPHFSKKMK
jgi:hypothetical protein